MNVGQIVRFKKEWANEGERAYLMVVKEIRLNPATMEKTRCLVQTFNSRASAFWHCQECEIEMLEPTGYTESDIMGKPIEDIEKALGISFDSHGLPLTW